MRTGSFFVGGRWIRTGGRSILIDQMYVSYRLPSRGNRAPIILVHGGGMTGAVFEETPDGRPGWAQVFSEAGHPVYVIDQPGRGRSRYHQPTHGEVTHLGVEWTERYMTATAQLGDWPQARRHTQWPGSGRRGDMTFDAFFASIVGHHTDYRQTEPRVSAALVNLLERLGPSIVVTHSQSGAFGWHVADRRPDLVRAIVAIEPTGPPFFNIAMVGSPNGSGLARPYGITATRLTFDRPLEVGEVLRPTLGPSPRRDTVRCYIQEAPARVLAHLRDVPVLVVTGEASIHATFDHGTVAFLQQAGVETHHLNLASAGIRGNGHLMMVEKNNREVATAIMDRLSTTSPPSD